MVCSKKESTWRSQWFWRVALLVVFTAGLISLICKRERRIIYLAIKINLRAGPSLNDSFFGTIKMGESVTLIEIGAAETPYVPVQYQDKTPKNWKTAYVT